jgi:hypothetical protein
VLGIKEQREADAVLHQIAGLIVGGAAHGRDAHTGGLEGRPYVFELMQVGAAWHAAVVADKGDHPRGIEQVVDVDGAAIDICQLDRADRVTNLSQLLHRRE